jgi:hypothetical protein
MIAPFSEEKIKDKTVSVLYDYSPESETLLICFAGVGIGMGIPYFEFMNALNQYDTKRIFLRDLRKAWYHAGIEGVGDTIDDCIPPLKKLIADSGAKYVITLGNSMGAYAAILFAILLEADEVLAFAPTTFANLWNRIRWADPRPSMYRYLKNAPVKPYKYYDLAKVQGGEKTNVHIIFDTDYRPDRVHAEHLAKARKNVHLHRYHGGKHLVIKNLKKEGELEKIIGASMERAKAHIEALKKEV